MSNDVERFREDQDRLPPMNQMTRIQKRDLNQRTEGEVRSRSSDYGR